MYNSLITHSKCYYIADVLFCLLNIICIIFLPCLPFGFVGFVDFNVKYFVWINLTYIVKPNTFLGTCYFKLIEKKVGEVHSNTVHTLCIFL